MSYRIFFGQIEAGTGRALSSSGRTANPTTSSALVGISLATLVPNFQVAVKDC